MSAAPEGKKRKRTPKEISPKIFALKISLIDSKKREPSIWRRINVPYTFNFWDLHVTIQDAMEWKDKYLHQFEIENYKTGEIVTIGLPGYADDDGRTIHEKDAKIADYFDSSIYLYHVKYNYGYNIDSWQQQIDIENCLISKAVQGTQYPKCTAGKGISPPENGVFTFDPESVKFDNSEERYANARH